MVQGGQGRDRPLEKVLVARTANFTLLSKPSLERISFTSMSHGIVVKSQDETEEKEELQQENNYGDLTGHHQINTTEVAPCWL